MSRPGSAATTTFAWLPDTGADVDAISQTDAKRIDSHLSQRLSDERLKICAANGERLESLGTCLVTLKLGEKSCQSVLHVFKKLSVPLLSRQSCMNLGLLPHGWPSFSIQAITQAGSIIVPPAETCDDLPISQVKEAILSEWSDVFQDEHLKPMAGPPMHIDLDSSAVPRKCFRARTIPFHWRDSVHSQLDSMMKKGVIERVPVGETYDWCHPMVVVPKKDSQEPRITVDLTALNKFVKRPAYPVRPPRDAVAAIPKGMKFFTKLDSRHGYWQVPLDEHSSTLTTFLTPWGPYRFKRNVMGLISAGDEHNRRSDDAFAGMENVVKVVEDVLIFDADFNTHVERVKSAIRRCSEHGITIHPKKFIFAQPSVSYCGYKVSRHGYTVDEHLVQALQKFPVPTNRTDVRSFCGLVQQFEAFCPELTEWLAPIRALLSPKADFVWSSSQASAFSKVIQELSSPRILASFDPGKPRRLETDAAQSRGLGMALWQQDSDGSWRLLQCGSRSVTSAESRYSATEIELLAVVWAIKKANTFLAGTSFELIVDHRPLVAIINSKSLDQITSPRLIRLKEKLSPYCMTAVWRPGKQHKVVDCFSRHPVESADSDDDGADIDACLMATLAAVNADDDSGETIMEDAHIVQVRDAGQKDDTYRKLKECISSGFPARRENLPLTLRPYWQIKDDLAIVDDIILFGQRMVIPLAMRKQVMKALHVSHQGQVRTLRRARQTVYWPNITQDIRTMVEQCDRCAERQASQPNQPLVVESHPSRPFESVAADLFCVEGKDFLVIVDKYSGWPVITPFRQHGVTSAHVIRAVKGMMMEKGIPVKFHSDGGPQFASRGVFPVL